MAVTDSSIERFLSSLQTLSTVSTFLAGSGYVVFTLTAEMALQTTPSTAALMIALFLSAFIAFVLTIASAMFFLAASLFTTHSLQPVDSAIGLEITCCKEQAINIHKSDVRARIGVWILKIGLFVYPIPFILIIFELDIVMGFAAFFALILSYLLYAIVKRREAAARKSVAKWMISTSDELE
jgi:hypothetical protein